LPKETYKLRVNGDSLEVRVKPDEPLLWVLRDQLRLTGAKYGCGEGLCGACMVMLDGIALPSCMVAVSSVGERHIETIEGLGVDGGLSPLQNAFKEHTASGCGYCTPGQIVCATALLRRDPTPSRSQIVNAMTGNLCRCAAYPNILTAIESVAGKKTGSSDS
jgi:aerobic-type carbon monoxide dehydrogenase small subunit (CoxS/CutS family)